MILYHFTSAEHLNRILADGIIRVTESNLNFLGEGPPVVWLSDEPDRQSQKGWAQGSLLDKTAVRITLEIPDSEAHQWEEWAGNRIEWWWKDALIRSGGGAAVADTWYVTERAVPREEWRDIAMVTPAGEAKIDFKEPTTQHD